MQIGVSVSIPASLRVRTTSSAASVPSTPSNLPPVGWVSRCEPSPTGGFDMDVETGGLAGVAEPVAHLLVLGAERQPPHPAFRRGAEFRGFVNGIPQAGGIDLQIGGGLAHAEVPVTYGDVVFNDAPAPARQPRRSTARSCRRDRRRVRPRPYPGRPASLPKMSAARS